VLPIQTAPRLGNLCQLYKAKICQKKTIEVSFQAPCGGLETAAPGLFQPAQL